jgi:large subunit ribosomal protein L2
VKPGNAMPLAVHAGRHDHPQHRDEAGKGGQIARSAGAYAQLVGRDQGMAIVRLNSGEQRLIQASACTGRRGLQPRSHEHQSRQGRPSRWLGKRPHVRGVAMNPVDHPHGGGEGRTSGGRHPVTPMGQADQGQAHPLEQATDKFIMRSRHQRKK